MITIYKPQELLDIAFKRSSKINVTFLPKTPDIIKAKKRELTRIGNVTDQLIEKLTQMVKTFPSFDNIHPFYYDLASVLVNLDQFKQIIASLSGTIRILKRLHQEHFNRIRKAQVPTDAAETRKAFYGRVSSVIGRLESKLDFLRGQRDKFRKLPTVSLDSFTIVVAGYPNVGKSSLVLAISTAKPEVSYYPFTTRNLIVGHRILDEEDPFSLKIQILDTPGLLDRPLSERNSIELQAIVALKHLANVIVFMIDPSESCGYLISNQLHLLKEIFTTFPNIPIIINLNKIDLTRDEQITQAKKEIQAIFTNKEAVILETIATQRIGVDNIFNTTMQYYKPNLQETPSEF